MLSFYGMEKYYQLLQVIQGYTQMIERYDNSLKAHSFDSVPRNGSIKTDRIDELLIRKENALKKLPQLKTLAASQWPEVSETIKAAVATVKKNRIQAALIFNMRYSSGHTWQEISSIVGNMSENAVKNLVIRCIDNIEVNT